MQKKLEINARSTVAKALLSLFLLVLTHSSTMAQNSNPKIYAAVLSNVSYTVGAKNAGVGLFVGDDTGDHWENIAFNNMRTFAIEIFPDHGAGLFYTANGNGVIVSRDGGESWRVTTGWEITEILEAAAVPDHPEIIYVGTAYGLWKSVEYGENWQNLTRRFVNAVHLDVANPDRVYLGEEDGMRISDDAGASFRSIKTPGDAVNHFAQDAAEPARLYLGTEDHGVFMSNDRGESWRHVDTAPATATVYGVTVDVKNPDRVFAGTFSDGILRSLDRGKTWESIANGIADITVYDVAVHPDDSQTLYAGTADRGIFRSIDAGATWHPFALDGTHVLEIEIK